MKATRRQALKSNELAETLESAREFFQKHGNYVVGGLVVIAVVMLGYVYMGRSAEQALADATRQMRALPFSTDDEVRDSIQRLERLAAEGEDEDLILDTLRRRGGMAMGRAHAADDGVPSREFLDLARAAQEEILERYPHRLLDAGTALLTLATIEEDLFVLDGDPAHKEATRRYLERVRDDQELNGTPFQTIALDRLNAIDRTFIKVVMVDAPPPPQPPAATMGPPSISVPTPGPGASDIPGARPVSADQIPRDILQKARDDIEAATRAKLEQQAATDESTAETSEEPAPAPAEPTPQAPREAPPDTPADQPDNGG